MKVALAILLNVALLAVLLSWLRRQWRWAAGRWWKIVLVLGLGLRVLVGVQRNWTLKLDAKFMSDFANQVSGQLWSDPKAAWHILTAPIAIFPMNDYAGVHLYDAVYQSTSNTWFLVKILVALNLGSMEMGWLNGLYFSLFAFVGSWQLVRRLANIFPNTPAGAGVVAFLFWPSVWFWATGLSKEAVLLGSSAWLIAQVLGYLYGSTRLSIAWWLGTVALVLLHLQMRYFFAVPLFGVLIGVALGHLLEQLGWASRRWAQVAVLAAVLVVGLWLAPKVSVAFSMNKFTNQMVRVYTHEVAESVGKPHLEYPNLRPTLESITVHAPLAVVNVLSRPWLGESRQPSFIIAGLENAGLVLLLVLALVAMVRGRSGHLPFGLGLGLAVFCVILAVLIGLTTPNLGSLNRYRIGLLPYLMLLLLQNDYAAAGLRRLGMGNKTDDH